MPRRIVFFAGARKRTADAFGAASLLADDVTDRKGDDERQDSDSEYGCQIH